MTPTIWHGCYEANWKGVITPESFAHPAKYSRALIERIFQHILAQGYVNRGDIVGDCFGGIATGGIIAAYAGLRWIGCELEPRFVAMADANFELHKDKWTRLGKHQPTIVQGDSRRFDEVVGAVAGVVCSPPFTSQAHHGGNTPTAVGIGRNTREQRPTEAAGNHNLVRTYGATKGQIDELPTGTVQAVVCSPPYSDIAAGAGGLNTKPATKPGQQSGRSAESASQSGNWSKDLLRYGKSEGQISRLKEGSLSAVVTSPPYADSVNSEQHGIDFSKAKKDYPGRVMHEQRVAHADKRHTEQSYGRTEGQIGALHAAPLDAVVTSPPYENSVHDGNGIDRTKLTGNPAGKNSQAFNEGYGDSEGQIGRERTETYWQAMAQVYAACHRAIKPGGVICVVVKDYVKNKQRVPLCDDTARLLEHVGFTVVERIHAMLVKETTHNDLFSGTTKTKTERKSFFRRLAEKKGSPEINWEEVIIARKP